MENEKTKWREAEKQRLKSKVETELAIAKIDWNKVGTHCGGFSFTLVFTLTVSTPGKLKSAGLQNHSAA